MRRLGFWKRVWTYDIQRRAFTSLGQRPDSITDYTGVKLQNLNARRKHVDTFRKALKSLGEMPYRYSTTSLVPRRKDIGLMPVLGYVMLYRVVDQEVQIIRIVYSRMDIGSLNLDGNLPNDDVDKEAPDDDF